VILFGFTFVVTRCCYYVDVVPVVALRCVARCFALVFTFATFVTFPFTFVCVVDHGCCYLRCYVTFCCVVVVCVVFGYVC